MKTCDECKYAQWDRTKAGKLHPNKEGLCKYPYQLPPLPNTMYFVDPPHIGGGYVRRDHEYNKHCPYWTRKEDEHAKR